MLLIKGGVTLIRSVWNFSLTGHAMLIDIAKQNYSGWKFCRAHNLPIQSLGLFHHLLNPIDISCLFPIIFDTFQNIKKR